MNGTAFAFMAGVSMAIESGIETVVCATAPETAQIRIIGTQDFGNWDDYVGAHAHGTPFHLIAWKNAIEDTFGYEPMYIVAERGGRVAGVLPLFLVKNILVRRALISTPFAVYGGTLADDDEVRDAMAGYVRQLGERLGVQYIELRNAYPEQSLGFAPVARYVTFTQQIGPYADAILEAIPRKTRRMVRKSVEAGFSVHVEKEDPGRFQKLYASNLRRLGTPEFPKEHFLNIMKYFQGSVEIREMHLKGQVAAAVLTFAFRNQVLPYYGASDPAFNAHAPTNFMYFDLMCSAGAQGFTVFDFGRSKKNAGSGSYDFKSHWGMVERELPYEMLLVKRKKLPNFSPANPVFQWPIKVWQRMPLWVTSRIGPMLIRLVP